MKHDRPGKKLIAFVSTNAWTMYNFRKEVLESILKSGYRVLIIAGNDEYAGLLISMGCDFVPVSIKNRSITPLHDVGLYFTLKNIYRQHRPDFVFHYVAKPNIYGSVAAGLLNISSVAMITGFGHAFNKNNLLKYVIKVLYKFSLRYAVEVWCLNKDNADFLIRHQIVQVEKLRVLSGEGVNTEYFRKNPLRAKTSSMFTFLMSARLLKSKGISDFAYATFILLKKNYKFQSLLLGVEEDHPDAVSPVQLLKWQKDYGLQYMGRKDDVRDFLSEADCFVYPSYYNEGVPRSLLEACSMSLPIITTDNTGCRELVEENVNGFICRKQDSVHLAARMEEMLLLTAEQRIEMGKKGRAMVKAKYAVDFVIHNYATTLQSYLAQ